MEIVALPVGNSFIINFPGSWGINSSILDLKLSILVTEILEKNASYLLPT